MDYHPVTDRIQNLLKEHNIDYKTFEHEAVRTSEEAAAVRPEYTIDQGAKAMIIRVKSSEGKSFAMVVLPADRRFDFKRVKEYFGAKDIRFATEDEVVELTKGVQPGGVPPFGNLFDLRVIADPALLTHEEIIFNAGDKRFSIAMKSTDYSKVVNPELVEIT